MSKTRAINVIRIDHVVIRADNLPIMVGFYRDVLGCVLERGPGKNGLAQLRAGDSLIDIVDTYGPIGKAGGVTPDRSAPNMDHVCLLVEPWDAAVIETHLKHHKVAFDPVEQRYGATGTGPSIYLKDPEGNTVELKGGVA